VAVETVKTASGYSFSFLAFPGEDLSFHPKSEEHLFDPESLHVFVDNDCHLVTEDVRAVDFVLLRSLTPRRCSNSESHKHLPFADISKKYMICDSQKL
jgi:hypothetical protein